ncbi:MAG: DNA polymerase III subunit delta [Brumimicrobium sp.]|nr:DNA polymerase III subunit delta [Brumimicrobium sp.]
MKDIIAQFKNRTPKPIYLLHGEEAYYIDRITQAAEDFLLDEHEKDFNLTVVYGKDVNMDQLQEQVKQYPMMAERQVVIVKEAQDIKSWDIMESYFSNPVSTTVLIIAHKHKKADSRTKFFKNVSKHGVVFESKPLYENQVENWLNEYIKSKGYTIEPKAALLLVEFLGTDLGKIVNELDKLAIILPKGTQITPNHIEENIGISKDYNAFELTNAIASRNIIKANKIIHYFEQNPKATHITALIPMIFNFHDRLMRAHFSQANSVNELMSKLKMSYPAAQEVMKAKQIYNPKKIATNIAILQEYDLKSKGINPGPGTDSDLLRELIFLLMH